MLTKITINSIDVSVYCINWQYERAYGDMLSELILKFIRNVNTAVPINTGLTVEVWRGWSTTTDEKIFSGYIEKFDPEGGLITITAIDKMWDLVRKEVTTVYESTGATAGKISAIATDLITTYGGLTADGTSVQDSGTTLTLQKFVCNHTDPFERLKALAEALDWQLYYRADTDKVYFEPKGFTSNANTLTVGSNVIQVPKWTYDHTAMVNDVTVVGAYQEVETTKSGQIGVTSGFTTTGISLDYEPISVKVYGAVTNPPTTLKIGGMPDSTGTFDYYVDKTQKKILPKASTTFTANDYYEIRYSLAAPIPINMYDQGSIDTYGRFTKTITLNDLRSVADAEARGVNYLAKYSVPFIYSTLRVKNLSTLGLAVGQKIQIIDSISIPAVNASLVINKIRIRWPADYDELEVGDKQWRLADFNAKVMEKLKRISEDEFANTDILNKLITVDNRSTNPLKIKPRYFQVLTQNMAGETLIWGSPTYGLWGTGKWGSTGTMSFLLGTAYGAALGTNTLGSTASAESVVRQVQGNNKYEEFIYDTIFYNNTSSSGVTWDTTGKTITITAGGIMYSNLLTLGMTYNYATLNYNAVYQTAPSMYVSADGKSNWQLLSKGIRTALTNTNTTGTYIKVVASAMTPSFGVSGWAFPLTFGSVLTFSNTYETGGSYDTPAISLFLEE